MLHETPTIRHGDVQVGNLDSSQVKQEQKKIGNCETQRAFYRYRLEKLRIGSGDDWDGSQAPAPDERWVRPPRYHDQDLLGQLPEDPTSGTRPLKRDRQTQKRFFHSPRPSDFIMLIIRFRVAC